MEHQIYGFRAVDRPLSDDDTAALLEVAPEAEIGLREMLDSYSWGDPRWVPAEVLGRYFDVYVLDSNLSAREVGMRLPDRLRADAEAAACRVGSYGSGVHLSSCGPGRFVLRVAVHGDVPAWGERLGWAGGADWTPTHNSSMFGVRDLLDAVEEARCGLLDGDTRFLYLAWLSVAVAFGDRRGGGSDLIEPPVPDGLGRLPARLDLLRRFLCVHRSLVAEAAAPAWVERRGGDPEEMRRRVRELPVGEREEILDRFVGGDRSVLHELRRRFGAPPGSLPRRTGIALAAAAEDGLPVAAAARALTEAERLASRRARLVDEVADDEHRAWGDVLDLLGKGGGAGYGPAVETLVLLRESYRRGGRDADFRAALRKLVPATGRRKVLAERMRDAGLIDAAGRPL